MAQRALGHLHRPRLASRQVVDAIKRLSAHGADVSRVELVVRPDALEISRGPRKLVVLRASTRARRSPAIPSVPVMLSELVTFLVPLPDEMVRRLARDLGDAAPLRLDPLVDVSRLDPTIAIDSRYATRRNAARRALYPPRMRRRCFVRQSVAEQLRRAQAALRRRGYGLKLWDGYRPHTIQWQCLDPRIIPNAAIRRLFVHPSQGSNHARGCAVDLTLIDRTTGRECAMPTDFDSASPAAASDATDGLSRDQLRNRRRLHAAMTRAGFVPLPHEWWHFNYRPDGNAARSRNAGDLYLVLDIPFAALLARPTSSTAPRV